MTSRTDTFRLRALRYLDDGVDAGDAATCAAIIAAHEQALLGAVETTSAEVRESLDWRYTDRAATALVLDDVDPVACVWVERDPISRQSFFVVHARPGERAQEAVAYAVEQSVARCREHEAEAPAAAAADPSAPWTIRSGSWIEDSQHFAALAANGFAPVRRFHQMRIDASSPDIPATAPTPPDGVEIVVARDEAIYRQMYAVDCAAFVDHWNFTAHPFDDWVVELVDAGTRDPDGMWLVTVDGVPAGLCVCDESRRELGDGYVAILGVAREFRGRGLAQLMLRTAFVRDRDRGLRGTRLGVDSENTTGAVRLYEGVGMRAVRTREGWMLTA